MNLFKLNNLGIDHLRLGVSIEGLPNLEPFGEKHSKMFIPSPNPQAWFQYTGEIKGISATSGRSFDASFVFIAVDSKKCIKRITIFAKNDSTVSIEEILSEAYGTYGYSQGGFSNLGGTENYKHFVFVTTGKEAQVIFYKPLSINYGLPEINLFFATDTDAIRNYKIVYPWYQV